MNERIRVLIAGIGGASLGTEVLKCLLLTDCYIIFGCDISEVAYGHFQEGFEKTFVVDRNRYVEDVLKICLETSVQYIIPGGEEPMVLLASASEQLAQHNIRLAGNSTEIIQTFSNKEKTFDKLAQLGFDIPLTKAISSPHDLNGFPFPCVIKPSVGTGGSSFVFLAGNYDDAALYVEYLTRSEKIAIAQEYISADEGEFTVGVLSLPDKRTVGSIALKRQLSSKLSVAFKNKYGLISSGYTQGLIDEFPEICAVSEKIASAIQSQGPINIQGRLKGGRFMPFEINPRFSASTYLRAMAGFNEIDIYLQYLNFGILKTSPQIRPGYYLRSLTETFVPN